MIAERDLENLYAACRYRQNEAFRPGTQANHNTQFSTYLAFCMYYGLQDINPTPSTICAYAEFLARTCKSPRTIKNYVSGVRLLHKNLGLDPPSLHCFQLQLILRAMEIAMDHFSNQKLPITVSMLRELCIACNTLGTLGSIIKCALLFGFYGFLRQSNLAPSTTASFDPRRNTCRGDVFEHPPGLVLLLKWTKTLQTGTSPQTLLLPAVPGDILCPLNAYKTMITAVPTPDNNAPLLIMPDTVNEPMTSVQLSKYLGVLLDSLGYTSSAYSLHSLRRGGATASYQAGTDFIRIKRHGTWKSDAFWKYVITNDTSDTRLAQDLADFVKRT